MEICLFVLLSSICNNLKDGEMEVAGVKPGYELTNSVLYFLGNFLKVFGWI
jgi:hypothetical protein